MLGIIGVLSGGYAFSGSQPPPPTVLMLPAGMAPEFVPDDAWATRAQVTLASLDQQLATLNEAEQAWRRTPAGRQDLAPPAEIAALQQRADLLEQRRATLQAQLDNYDSLTRAQQDLENTEAHLRSVREALAAAPSEATSREQAATLAALQDQRELRERQLASREEELRSLQDTVRSAIRTPLPDDDEVTEAVRAEAVEAAGIEVGPDPAADQQTPDRDGDADRREPDDDRSDAPTRPADRDADERQPGRDRPDAATRPADPGADQREPAGDPSDADVPTRPGDQDVDLRERDTDAAARPDARAEVPATGPTGSGAGDRPRTPADRDGKTEDRTDGGRGTEPAGDAVSEVDEDLEQRGDAPDRDRPDEAGSADGTASPTGSEDDREGREDRSGRQPAGSAGGPEDTARKDQERPDRPADSGDPDGDEGDGTSDDRRPDDRARIEDRVPTPREEDQPDRQGGDDRERDREPGTGRPDHPAEDGSPDRAPAPAAGPGGADGGAIGTRPDRTAPGTTADGQRAGRHHAPEADRDRTEIIEIDPGSGPGAAGGAAAAEAATGLGATGAGHGLGSAAGTIASGLGQAEAGQGPGSAAGRVASGLGSPAARQGLGSADRTAEEGFGSRPETGGATGQGLGAAVAAAAQQVSPELQAGGRHRAS